MDKNILSDYLIGKQSPVAILGSGISGRAAEKLLASQGIESELFDEKSRNFKKRDANSCSFVVQSPGFRPDHQWVRQAIEAGKTVISEVDLGMQYSDHSEIIAITGTNGKTSLTSILGHIARKLKIPCIELGNIGIPLSEAVRNREVTKKIIFHETSSFQAASSQNFHPDCVLWTNFDTDHLDYHHSEKEYFLSKLKIANSCKNPRKVLIGSSVKETARKYGIQLNILFREIAPLSLEDCPVKIGSFHQSLPQLENLAFAIKWFEHKGISKSQCFDALQGYQPHPHRLKKVTTINEISFWNDSKSTNLASTLAACRSFPEKVIWIGGGKNKGQQIDKFSSSLYPYLQSVFLIGETSFELSKYFGQKGIKSEICENLKVAISEAFKCAKKCTNILFSPGFASFDMFANYSARGNSFESLVFDLKSALQVTTKLSTNHLQAS